MDIVRTYARLHPNEEVVIIGGAAAAIWIEHYLGVKIPLKDIDVHINTQRSVDEVYRDWLALLPNYEGEPGEVFSLFPIDGNGISYDIFINQAIVHPVWIDGLLVDSLYNVLKTHESYIEGAEIDLSYYPDDEYTRDKLRRYRQRLNLLNEIYKHRQ